MGCADSLIAIELHALQGWAVGAEEQAAAGLAGGGCGGEVIFEENVVAAHLATRQPFSVLHRAGFGVGNAKSYSVTGDTVNTAQRLQSMATPGEILVGPLTHRLTRHAFAYESLGDVALNLSFWPIGMTTSLISGLPRRLTCTH